jgi:hypothetical protein|tara:strand:+ start:42 stop:164 length:123 start_codon:yes stop_codon:yes gene_type:complete
MEDLTMTTDEKEIRRKLAVLKRAEEEKWSCFLDQLAARIR